MCGAQCQAVFFIIVRYRANGIFCYVGDGGNDHYSQDNGSCEDAEAGIEAAINAGMRTVGIGNPQILNRADVVVPNLKGFTYSKLIELFLIK